MKVQYVPAELTAQSWPEVEKFIDAAIEHSHGDYTLEQVKVFVCMGQWLLVVATDENNQVQGAATVSFINMPNDRVAYITTIGGRLVANEETFSQLCGVLKYRGATKIQGLGRPAIVRLWSRLGFKPVSTLVEYKL